MPEPKKTKRTYEVQIESPLEGLHLVPQRSSQADTGETPAARKGKKAGDAAPEPGESELVSRLIDFIKKI
jgi:hypothetical protein